MGAQMLDEHGFTLVELLIAMVLTSVGVAATIGVFGASGRATLTSQRIEVAAQQGQAELDRLSNLAYGELALTATPVASVDPKSPNYRVNGSNLTVRPGVSEALVTTPGSGFTAKVVPGPSSFSVGQAGSTITGKIYRYVTWRDENCPATICDGSQNTKRVIVAIALDATANTAQRAAIWFSTVITDPNAAPTGYTGTGSSGSGTGPNTSAQVFYLYDEPCDDKDWDDFTYHAPAADHNTRNSAQRDSPSSTNSVCSNPQEPDVMGVQPPPGDSATPLYKYSADLTGSYSAGLAMTRKGTSCRRNYSVAEASNSAGPNKWAVHAWTTPEFETTFHLSGRATVSAWTQTVGTAAGRGLLCATLLERRVTSAVPADTTIASTTFDVASWPTTPRRLSFTFTISPEVDIDVGNQLVLVLHLRAESDQDIALLYDHPTYESLLEVETTTPIGG